jgi:hypothetical protein
VAQAQETKALSTTANAQFIETKTDEATKHIHAAIMALREAAEAIKSGENEPEFKLPNFADLEGLLSIGIKQARLSGVEWSGYANARARH